MLDNSAIPDSLNIDRPQRNPFPRGWHTREGAQMSAPHYIPSRNDVALGHLSLNGHDHIRLAVPEREHMLTGLIDSCDPELGRHILRCQEVRKAIHGAGVDVSRLHADQGRSLAPGEHRRERRGGSKF